MHMHTSLNLGALLQLSSPALPVGAYSYSQGLESAIDCGEVRDDATAAVWIEQTLRHVLGCYEAPVWWRLRASWDSGRMAAFRTWNEEFIATRETRELRAETLQMGYSLVQLLRAIDGGPQPLHELALEDIAYPAAHATASAAWQIDPAAALYGYLYGWVENQVMAALKAVPLGQMAGQRLLLRLRAVIDEVTVRAMTLPDAELSTQAPALGILSSRHEIQYSRLFRS